MIFVYILRFITGFVKFRAGGGFSERFVNLCNLSGIPLWDITYDGDNVFACTTIDGYKKIISCARKSGMTTKSLKRVGLPFILFRFRSRSGLAIGLALMMLTLSILSGRIWIIDVTGNEIVPDEEIIAAAKAAHAHSFKKRLPKGYDTFIGEDGGLLSAGQKQLLCITRVMLSLPPVLILDEATSSIDTRTEIRIQKAFNKMMEGRTSFIVAHRLSTIKEADLIIVMKDGKVIETGTHESLLASRGFYADLFNAQYAR